MLSYKITKKDQYLINSNLQKLLSMLQELNEGTDFPVIKINAFYPTIAKLIKSVDGAKFRRIKSKKSMIQVKLVLDSIRNTKLNSN